MKLKFVLILLMAAIMSPGLESNVYGDDARLGSTIPGLTDSRFDGGDSRGAFFDRRNIVRDRRPFIGRPFIRRPFIDRPFIRRPFVRFPFIRRPIIIIDDDFDDDNRFFFDD